MKVKKELIILGCVIVALVLYLVFQKKDRTLYQLPEIPKLAETEISKIEIGKAGRTMLLQKVGDDWVVGQNKYPADTGKVKRMVNVIASLTLTALVSESKNFFRYDLSDDKKIHIKAWVKGKTGREFFIGKPAPTYRHTFVRLAGDANVYHARDDFKNTFDQSVENLRDMTVLSFEKSEIREIAFMKDKKTTTVARVQPPEITGEKTDNKTADAPPPPAPKTKTTWQTGQGQAVDTSKPESLLSVLSGLRCEKYINNKEKADFKDPLYQVTVTGGKPYTLSIFSAEEEKAKQFPAVSSESAYPFYLSGSQVDRIKALMVEMVKKDKTS